ncbi:Serine/threonine kinase [Cytospora paraplurivora]|uniref:Serine/threonine kinase n=1 Tax=Cytospora paraplurivora TaxID=2898453 RepID=A0AAN9YCX1_9PEZI
MKNVASDIIPGKVLTSKSGTLAYLAPEVYAGHGYDKRADWWSLGVLFYECIYNKRPFEGNSENALSKVIQAANPKYPITQPPVSLLCLYAIKDALTADPNKRLGRTWDSFIYHDFFRGIDFEALERKEIEPVFIPSSEKTNFDATYDLEELLLEEAPLEARARRQKPRERLKDDATEKEIREEELYKMIESDFRPFDYTVAAYKKIAEAHGPNEAGQPGAAGTNGLTDAQQPQALTTDEASPLSQARVTSNGYHTGHGQPLAPTGTTDGNPQHHGSGLPHKDRKGIAVRPPPLPPYPNSYTNSKHGHGKAGPKGIFVESPTGGVQVTLDGGGSWSDLARQDATLPADAAGAAQEGGKVEASSGGVFGFLSRKKGRGGSPKPKERGVLGKEGARVVIG